MKIFIALLALTALTTGAAFIPLGPFNDALAILIAVSKATLVVLFFMNVKYSSRLTWAFAIAGFCWLAVLLGLSATDFFTRHWIPQPSIFP
ncbi:MAG: cytochrome C oxidase subunit IV family protein [Rhodospirillales bacterium]